jgi:transcription antitermination protein NusB
VPRRHDARRQAIDILYQADVLGELALDVADEWAAAGKKIAPFALELVQGVSDHLDELDTILGEHAEGWSVPRMPSVDRTLLRVGCYELLHRPDVPSGAAIDEAVEAAKQLSTEDSGRFVNGVLGKIARELGAD